MITMIDRSIMKRRAVRRPSKSKGVTLIEMLVVVVILAIIAAIAIPSYSNMVRKGRRGAVKAQMSELAQRAQRYYTANNQYSDAMNIPEMVDGKVFSPAGSTAATAFYEITFEDVTATTYTLTAEPLKDQVKDVCKTLSHLGS